MLRKFTRRPRRSRESLGNAAVSGVLSGIVRALLDWLRDLI